MNYGAKFNSAQNLVILGGFGEANLALEPVGRYRHFSVAAGVRIAPQTTVRVSTWNESRAVWINRILGIDVGIVPGGRFSSFSPGWIGPGVLSACFLARPLFLAFPCAGSMAR